MSTSTQALAPKVVIGLTMGWIFHSLMMRWRSCTKYHKTYTSGAGTNGSEVTWWCYRTCFTPKASAASFGAVILASLATCIGKDTPHLWIIYGCIANKFTRNLDFHVRWIIIITNSYSNINLQQGHATTWVGLHCWVLVLMLMWCLLWHNIFRDICGCTQELLVYL